MRSYAIPDTESGIYWQLFHGGAFDGEYLSVGTKRQHGSDDISGDDNLLAAIWEATSAQNTFLSLKKHAFEYGNMKYCLLSGRPASLTVKFAAFVASIEVTAKFRPEINGVTRRAAIDQI